MSETGKASVAPVAKTEIKAKPQPVKIITNELYFDTHRALPFLLTAPNKTIGFGFTIHNLKKDSVYQYSVYMDNNGQITQIDNNQVSLKQNEYKTISESFTLTTPINVAKIFVKLTNDNNYIYFKVKQI